MFCGIQFARDVILLLKGLRLAICEFSPWSEQFLDLDFLEELNAHVR